MAVVQKNARTLLANESLAPGSVAIGPGHSLLDSLGGLLTLVVSNGPTGPTTGCEAIVEISADQVQWYELSRHRAGTASSATFVFHVDVASSVMFARAKFLGNTGQSVNIEANIYELQFIS